MTDDDIIIPDIDIDEGWPLSDVKTEDDCIDAIAFLTQAINRINEKMAAAKEKGTNKGEGYQRLVSALRWKNTALMEVQMIRSRLNAIKRREQSESEQRRLVAVLRTMVTPEQWALAVKEVQNERR